MIYLRYNKPTGQLFSNNNKGYAALSTNFHFPIPKIMLEFNDSVDCEKTQTQPKIRLKEARRSSCCDILNTCLESQNYNLLYICNWINFINH